MDWLFVTDEVSVEELRRRCRRERLAQNITQADLALRAGVSVNTIRRFERDDDSSPSLETFVRVVRVLGGLEVLEQVLPERPLDPLNPDAPERRRARPSAPETSAGEWTWAEPQ